MNKVKPTSTSTTASPTNNIPEESDSNNIDYNELTFEETKNNNSIKESKPQVFNLPENVYTYDDAKIACKAVVHMQVHYNFHTHKAGAIYVEILV